MIIHGLDGLLLLIVCEIHNGGHVEVPCSHTWQLPSGRDTTSVQAPLSKCSHPLSQTPSHSRLFRVIWWVYEWYPNIDSGIHSKSARICLRGRHLRLTPIGIFLGSALKFFSSGNTSTYNFSTAKQCSKFEKCWWYRTNNH